MSANSKSNAANVLIIEDDQILSECIEDVLIMAGCKVYSLESVELVDDLSFIDNFDIILLDLNLPGEDGISFAKRIRARNQLIGLVIHSARSASRDIGEGYQSGADIFITKPASMDEIRNAVQSLQNRLKHSYNSNLYTLNLNTRKNILSLGNKSIYLTQIQSTLLVSFIRARNNILETWQIAEVLGLDLDNLNKSIIELHISRLRKKILSIVTSQTTISSIRNRGYQLEIHVKIEN